MKIGGLILMKSIIRELRIKDWRDDTLLVLI